MVRTPFAGPRRALLLAVAVVPALVTLGFLLWLMRPWEGLPGTGAPVEDALSTAAMVLWILTPYLAIALLLWFAAPADRVVRWLFVGYGILMGAAGIIGYIEVVRSDSSTAVVALMFYPIFQLVVALVCVGLVAVRSLRRRSMIGPPVSPTGHSAGSR